MTAEERRQLRIAVRLFMNEADGEWERAMEIVCKLARMETAIQRLPKNMPALAPWEMAAFPVGKFSVGEGAKKKRRGSAR